MSESKTTTGPEKPAYGAPCNGCGFCCASEVCAIGKIAFPDAPAPCPGMVFDDGRFNCMIVIGERLAGMEPLIANALGIGRGCCAE